MRTLAAMYLATWLVLGILATFATIGHERKPITPELFVAVAAVALTELFAVMYLYSS